MYASSRSRVTVYVLLFVALAVVLTACGTDDGGSGDSGVASGGGSAASQRSVVDDGRTYSIDDIKATGAKTPKQYDVTDLPAATDAWNVIYNQKEYEVRFYPTHADAVSTGTSWAESVSGEDAKVVGDDVVWEEGAKDRRQCNRSVAHSGCDYSARYGDFIILGNMIMLCEGKDSAEALATCAVLTELLG